MSESKSLEYYVNSIQRLLHDNNFQEALVMINNAINKFPSNPKLYINGGNIYKLFGDLDNAEKYFKIALNFYKSKEAFNNLSVIELEKYNFEQAIEYAKNALDIDSGYIDANYNLALSLERIGAYDEASTYAKKSCLLSNNELKCVVLLFRISQNICDWMEINKIEDVLNQAVGNGIEHPFLNISRVDDEEINYKVAKSWAETNSFNKINGNHKIISKKNGKLKIGYICGELRNHPTYFLINGLFKNHNKNLFETFIFTYNHDESFSKNIKYDIDHFIDVTEISDEIAIKTINDLDLDILIDLSILISGNRQRIVSARPAKKIISYLGFPGTSGYSFYDYIITDNIVTPESHQKYYTEKFLYLPRYQVNDGRGMIETNSIKKSDVNLPEKSIVLSCFNQSFKLDSMMFSCWIKILNHIPNSCLWLLEDNEFAKKNIIDYSESNGLDKNKIIFAPRISRDMHMERLKLSDISLDTRIYNGHTTTTDSLQSSIPVVTLEGNHFASRVSASLIKSYGLDDLIVQSLDEYHQKVIKLCLDRDYMSSIRKKIKDKKNINRFFNVKEFTKHLEDQLIDIIKN